MPPDQVFGDYRSTGRSCGLVHEFLLLAIAVSDVYSQVFPTHTVIVVQSGYHEIVLSHDGISHTSAIARPSKGAPALNVISP